MTSGSERTFHLMRLAMGRFPPVDATVTIEKLADACQYAYDNKTDVVSVVRNTVLLEDSAVNPSNAIYLSDLDITPSYIKLLLVRGDPTTGRKSYTNVKTRSVIPAETNDPDAVPGVSTHIIIEKAIVATGDAKGKHRMILEKATNLGRTLVRDYIGVILARYANEHQDQFVATKKAQKKSDKPETVSYRPTVRFFPQPNASLKHDLENGKIGGFTLLRGTAKYNGPADAAHVMKSNVKLHAVLAPTGELDDVVKTAKNMAQVMMPSVDFGSLKLDLVDDDGKLTSTQMLPMENIENSDMRYCRSITDDSFQELLDDCYASLHPEIVKRAIQKLDVKKYWE